jgi:hypothetical protein
MPTTEIAVAATVEMNVGQAALAGFRCDQS